MPRGDGTGPAGFGPMTGRGAGYCAGYQSAGFMNPLFGRGFGCGWGRGGGGFGRRNRFYATGLTGWQRAAMGAPPYPPAFAPYFSREQQVDALRSQAGYLEQELEAIRKRLEELESKTGE